MNNRMSTILASESTTTAATKVIDLTENAPLSKIVLRFKGTNNGSTPTAHPAKMVTKIEVVDGSDVLYSMSGVEAQAMNFLETHELPFGINEYENNIQCCATYDLNFGRFPWDRDFALDLTRFKNPQLKISHDKALGGSAPDAGTMAVFGYTFDDPQPTPANFLMTKELYSYTLTAGANEYITCPRDYPYRVLMPNSYETTYAFNTQFSEFEWYANNRGRVFINTISGSEWAKLMSHMDKVEEDWAGLGTGSAVSYYQAGTYEGYVTAVGRSHSQTTLIASQPSGPRVQITNDTSESFAAHQNAYMAFGGTNLCMHELNDPAAWFNPLEYGDVELRIKAGGSASGTINVSLQQNRPNVAQ
ncbi:MAG: hypothetical protein KAJ10_05280 [Thermodesulfovibrionia bacterium]|nr:hypothetical protein [Thermodesulfovibrionia bacterium]